MRFRPALGERHPVDRHAQNRHRAQGHGDDGPYGEQHGAAPAALGRRRHWSRWSPTHFGGWGARRATVFEPAQYAAPQPNHHRLWGEHSDQPADGHETAQRQPGSGERHIIEQRHRNTPIRGEIPGDGVNGQCQSRGGHGGSRHIDDD